MADALIGYSGFVGSTLLRQRSFEGLFRANNVHEIEGQSFNLMVGAGAPAQKWIANKDPEGDALKIKGLIRHLQGVRSKTFVLISTVDVFKNPVAVDESSPVDEDGLHAYGLNRRALEKFVQGHFERSLIVRLPGLVGPGLRKNVIFDFLNDNNLATIDSRGVFQFYPMVNLWQDIQTALDAGLDLLHLTAEPISVADVSRLGFGRRFEQAVAPTAGRYDMRSRHAALFGGQGAYQYSARETVQAVRAYAQTEPKSTPLA